MAFGNLKVDTITSSTRTINVDSILAGGDGSGVTFIAASGDAPLSVSGSPITSSGTLTISLDQSALSIAPSQLASGALPSGVTVASVNIANGTIVNEDISDSASIDPAKISGVAVVSGDVRLSDERTPIDESVTNAKVASGAAIELSKLATGLLPSGITIASTNITDGAIVDADINDSAAIALTKLASGTLPSGIAIASGTDASTNLSYDDSTRVLSSSTGSSATLPLVTSSAAGLVPEFGTVTGKVLTDGGWAAPSTGSPGGSSGQIQFNNGGVFDGVSTTSVDGSGNMTFSGRWIQSRNGAADAPPLSLTGTWFTGGTATTTKPQFLIEPAGTTSTAWSTAGTGLGVNAPSGFTGNLLDLQVNGTSRLAVTSAGAINMPAIGFVNEHISFGNANGIQINGAGRWGAKAAGALAWTITNTVFTINSAYDFGFSNTSADGTQDVTLKRDSAGTLAQRNGTNAQTYRLYNTFTSATNFERLNVRWTSNEAILDTEAGGDGGTLRGLKIGSASTSLLGFYGATPVDQPAAVANATDTTDIVAQFNALLARVRELGLIAT